MSKKAAPTLTTVFVTGASGFVGTALCQRLEAEGYTVLRATRDATKGRQKGFVYWNPDANALDTDTLAQAQPQAVVHLAGPSIGKHWWPSYKQYMMDNRTASARLLAEALSALKVKPQVVIGASAIGYYGNSTTPVDETAPKGTGFAADLVAAMETALAPLKKAKIRTVHARLGIVIGQDGGALKQMLPPFRLGLGGPMGSGEQMMSWVALEDVVEVLLRLMTDSTIDGIVNVTSPNPVSNGRFSRTLAQVLGRPCLFSTPGFAVRLLFGQMGKELLLDGAAVMPSVLLAKGYRFRIPHADEALRRALLH
jgi:uncharacterized protein (TIGR01777 family)